MRIKTILVILLLAIIGVTLYFLDKGVTGYAGEKSPLPLPSTLSLDEYETKLYAFLDDREYEKLEWKHDKGVRNTGPFVNDVAYGTHPAVMIYYSPEVYHWLKKGRKGEIPDGAMIVKVMYAPPAQRYMDMDLAGLDSLEEDPNSEFFEGWTVMVKDKSGAKDGWFWSYYGHGEGVDQLNKYPFNYPNSGFGNYCVRCHASAENEFTFSSLTNIEGEKGDPITYYVDESWRDDAKGMAYTGSHERLAEGDPHALLMSGTDSSTLDSTFLKVFSYYPPVSKDSVKHFPPVTFDHVVSGPNGPEQYITSDQCLSCHDGQSGNFLPNMLVGDPHSDTAKNVSPYGEWRWSMMGLAGRDPIFFAQLESEKTIHNQGNLPNTIQNLCFRCHGVMGQKQFHIDYPSPDSLFKIEELYRYDYEKPEGKYGALAREGVSCMSCHQIIDDGKTLEEIETGQFVTSPPGEVHGPFKNPKAHAMREALGIVPKHSDYTQQSRLCGSCHTINLPVYNNKGVQVGTHYEQATYLEWVNSNFQNEYVPNGSNVKTCQDCHMPTTYPFGKGKELQYKIANIQDEDYPASDHLVALDSVDIVERKGFKRHTLLGINVYGLQMFDQFDDILGVRKTDYMTGLSNGLPNAIINSDYLAKTQSVDVKVVSTNYSNGTLTSEVEVTNLTGHRFPSGVGFRRAFIQFAVINSKGDTVWASGRTNSVGVITDQNGIALPSEFLERNAQGVQQYEPHYTTISAQNQVQIYQELAKNPEGEFTTSFVSIDTVPKDNRLLPDGWTPTGPKGFSKEFAEATHPHGNATTDALYMSGQGKDAITYSVNIPQSKIQGGKVVAVMYYQSIPPFYLNQRFKTAKGAGGQRLFYMASNLDTKGTPVEGWVLETGKDEKAIQ